MKYFGYYLLLIFMISCEPTIYQDVGFTTIYELAQNKNKKLWLMIGGGDNCISCNNMITKLEEKGIFKKYSKDYLFYKCNVTDTSNIFLHYIFLTEEIPNSYIFNEKGELIFASYQRETVNKIEESLKFCKTGGRYHCAQNQFQNLNTDKILTIHNYTLKAYLNYNKNQETLSYIDSSINIHPYFYNLYLKSKILNKLGEKYKADEIEKMCISYYKHGFQALVYKDIYESLKIKYNKTDIENNNTAKIKFDNEILDIGEISYGKEHKLSFGFQNMGTKPLIIFAVKTDCACVGAKFNKKPVLPNEKSSIEIVFNEKEKGLFSREIHVLSNSKESYLKLTVHGNTK